MKEKYMTTGACAHFISANANASAKSVKLKISTLIEVHVSQNEDISYNIDCIKRITRKTYQ